MFDALSWMNVAVTAISSSKLRSYITSIELTYRASDHDRSVTCHVPAIQKSTDISQRHLPGRQCRQRSDRCNGYESCFIG
jgi:hypothetical protein